MSSITLEFPTLVQTIEKENGTEYRIRPLFMKEPFAENRRFKKAMSTFQKEIRKKFRYFKTTRENIDELLWFKFNPEVKFLKTELAFHFGQEFVTGTFTIVWFEFCGMRLVCLPGFDNFFFIASQNEAGRYKIEEQAEKVIQHLLRKKKQKYGYCQADEHMTTKGETQTIVSLNISVREGKFSFEPCSDASFAAFFRSDIQFEGEWEILKVGYDMNTLYPDDLTLAYYRDDIIDRLSPLIYQKEKTPIVIVGPDGVGKSSILQNIVHDFLKKNEHRRFYTNEKVWHIDPTRIIAGMSIVGMWQNRFEAILEYVCKRIAKLGKTDKLYFDNIIALLRIGKSAQNDMTLSDVLKPYLEKRKIQVIAEATPAEWKIVQEKDRRFADLFQVIRISEPSDVVASKMILKKRTFFEKLHNCHVSIQAINRILVLQRTHMKNLALPGGAIKFLQQISIKYKNQEIDDKEVNKEFESVNHINNKIFDTAVSLEKGEIWQELKDKLVGQDEALSCLVDTISTIKAFLNNPDKPLGTFLFIGPTGVGKTQASKVLADYLFHDKESLVRFDMNEYIDSNSVSRLIGNIYNPEGQLTVKVRYRPFCVLLFDEIEKAHPSVHDLLLQILGEGRLSDALGRMVDFTNTIVIMTSNIGANEDRQTIGFGSSHHVRKGVYMKAVENFFRPEFLNRIDRVVVFQRLDLKSIKKIARNQINDLLRRDGFVRRTTILNISPKALDLVAKRGYEPELGGRALKRRIEKDLSIMTAEQLVEFKMNQAIILEIFAYKDTLVSRVTPLIQAEPQEALFVKVFDNKELISEFQKLLDTVNGMLEYLTDSKEILLQKKRFSEADYYELKDDFIEVKTPLENLIWKLEEAEQTKQTVFQNPARPRWKKRRCSDYKTRSEFRDLFSKIDIKEYLNNIYNVGIHIVKESQAEYLKYFIKISYLRFFNHGFLERQNQKVCFSIKSCVEEIGSKEVDYLYKHYNNILQSFNFSSNLVSSSNTQKLLLCEGIRIYDLMKSEEGIHMFHIPHTSPIPIEVSIGLIPEKKNPRGFIKEMLKQNYKWKEQLENGKIELKDIPKTLGRILRVYCLDYENGNDDIITDLRSAMTGKSDLTTDDYKLLLYNNLTLEK